MRKLRKGDEVIVIAGKDKGKRGRIDRVFPKIKCPNKEKVVIDGINLAKRHLKPNPGREIQGGIEEKAMPIHISNVAILNPTTNKADRVGILILKTGEKVRVFKSNGEVIPTSKDR